MKEEEKGCGVWGEEEGGKEGEGEREREREREKVLFFLYQKRERAKTLFSFSIFERRSWNGRGVGERVREKERQKKGKREERWRFDQAAEERTGNKKQLFLLAFLTFFSSEDSAFF